MATPPPDVRTQWQHSNPLRLAVSTACGITAGLLDYFFGLREVALLVCGDVGAIVYIVWLYKAAMCLDADETCALATREDPGRVTVDIVILLACMAALGAVGVVLFQSSQAKGTQQDLLAGVGLFSVFCAWALVQSVFTLRYARLYYADPVGGIGFNTDERPAFIEFAYLAFTVGMTFQVSDTDIGQRDIRRLVLRHAFLSYIYGTVIVATTINLVAGLGK